MFQNLREFILDGEILAIDQDGKPADRDLQIASLALLVQTATIDRILSSQEIESIVAAMFHGFGLSPEESGELVEITSVLQSQRDRSEEFLKAVNSHFSLDQKEQLLELVWLVVRADGQAEKIETQFAAELRRKLGLTLEQAVRARQMAELSIVERSKQATAAAKEREEEESEAY